MTLYHPIQQRFLADCQRGLPVQVVLGDPEYKDCRYHGICKIFLEPRSTEGLPDCGTPASAYLRADRPTGRLLLHFLRCDISPADRRAHFPGGFMAVPHAYHLPANISKALQLPPGRYAILPGRYPVLDDGTFLTCSCRVGRCA